MKRKQLLLRVLMVSMMLGGIMAPAYAEEEGAAVSEAAETEAPVTEAPETEAAVTEAPVTEAPETEAAVTDAPTTESEAPATESEAPETEAGTPKTEEAATETEAADAPETEETTEFSVSEVMAEKEEEDTEAMTEALFLCGYAQVKKGTPVYGAKISAGEVREGSFTEKSIVYVLERSQQDEDDNEENDWMHIVFAVDRNGVTETKEGYVRAEALLPYGEEEAKSLAASLSGNAAHVLYQGNAQIPLVPAAFEEKEPESEQETAETQDAVQKVYEISATWENETLGIGDLVTLSALCGAKDKVIWQSSEDGEVWTEIAEGTTYTYELTEENYRLSLRAAAEESTDAGEGE